jgi:hypothetical protein
MNAVSEDNKFNFIENETFYGEIVDLNKSVSPDRNVTDALSRNLKFDKPPRSVQSEVLADSIVDEWEQSA